MKREHFKNINISKFILSIVLIFTFCINAFADEFTEKWGPAAANVVGETVDPSLAARVISDYDFNQQNATGQITSGDIAAIKQIVVAEPNLNMQNQTPANQTPVIGTNLNLPNPSDFVAAPAIDNLNLSTFTTKAEIKSAKVETGAPTFALINATTKEIYTTKDATTKYNPSGLTNLMTAYIATKHLSMEANLKVNASAVRGLDKDASIAALSAGDTITLKDAIGSMFVKGCVDSSNVVAENVAGSISNFVALMNTEAKELGLTNTKFVDPSGIGQNESTALDMAIIMAKVCENQELIELLDLVQYKLPKAQKREQLILYSRNTMLNKDNATYNGDVKASRLAYSSATKYCIASLMQNNNNNIIAVVLKAEGQQFAATKKLLEYAKVALGTGTTTAKN